MEYETATKGKQIMLMSIDTEQSASNYATQRRRPKNITSEFHNKFSTYEFYVKRSPHGWLRECLYEMYEILDTFWYAKCVNNESFP